METERKKILRAARQKKPMGVMFHPDLAKRTLQRRVEHISRLVAERKKSKTAYFIMDKLVARDKPPDVQEFLNFIDNLLLIICCKKLPRKKSAF